MMTRRQLLVSSLAALGGGALLRKGAAGSNAGHAGEGPAGEANLSGAPRPPVVIPDGARLPYKLKNGVKEFHLVAEPVEREFAPGMKVKCWGYNGLTPGPTIEAVEGDRVRILVTNRLPEHTTIHWHGIFLPNGMDGVGGLNQPHIQPGETYVYEFTLKQHGTFMYHPHADEMLQLAVGMMGFFIVHPRAPESPRIDRDFAIMLHTWAIHPGTYRPDPAVMLDFNIFSFNSKVFPATAPLLVETGDRVRLRFANLSMDEHPIHIHGHAFRVTATDGGRIPEAGQWPETTVLVPVGATRDVEFVADAPGDWALHCHKSHHTMNPMGHDVPNTLGVNQKGLEERIRRLVPGYMAMGETGMAEHAEHGAHMPGPENTLPMMMGKGPFGNIEMGGMFTVVKIRDRLDPAEKDPGWYDHPPGSVAYRLS
jgi:FtsP/CotA-like multicopper oxidase with cupredoxin domain